MNANRFFSIPFNAYDDYDMKRLRMRQGGVAAYGRWVAMLGMLYDSDGRISVESDDECAILKDSLELDSDGLKSYLNDLVDVGFIDGVMLEKGVVVSRGVCDEIEYRKQRSEVGKSGGRPKKRK